MEDLKLRTKEFAKLIINLFRNLPATEEARMVGRQLFRSGTSVAANYRAACRGKSKADFMAKLSIALEECDETLFWLEMLVETEMMPKERLASLMDETNQLVAIFVASLKTAKQNH